MIFCFVVSFQLDQVPPLTYCITSGASTRRRRQGCWRLGKDGLTPVSASLGCQPLETTAHVLPSGVSCHTNHGNVTRSSSWGGARVTRWANVSACGRAVPAQRKRWKWMRMGGRGRAGPRLLGAACGWVRWSVVWNWARAEAWIKAPSQRVRVRDRKRLAIHFCGEIEEVYLILLEDISLRAVAHSRSPPSPSPTRAHTRTHIRAHTMAALLVWKNAPQGAAHPRTQLCLRLKSWWITAGSLKSPQLSDLYQKWGQLEYAPFNANYTHSWIPYHLVNATPNCQGLRAPESTETKGRWGFSLTWMQVF